MRGLYARVLGTVCALAVCALSEPLRAAERRIVIEVPERTSELLDEALVRVRGELSAMDLSAEVISVSKGAPESLTDAEGTLLITREGSRIRIVARGAGGAEIVQELDARATETTAEVVAVRAVEALRAVLLGGQRAAEPATKSAAKPALPAPSREPAAPLREAPTPNARARSTQRAEFWLGPQSHYDPAAHSFTLGGELGARYRLADCFLGLMLDQSRRAARFDDASGYVDVQRTSVSAEGGCALELAYPAELFASLGAGGAFYSIQGHPEPGFLGQNSRQASPLVRLSAGGAAFVSEALGFYLRAEASIATRAPLIVANSHELGSFERPLAGASLGVLVRTP